MLVARSPQVVPASDVSNLDSNGLDVAWPQRCKCAPMRSDTILLHNSHRKSMKQLNPSPSSWKPWALRLALPAATRSVDDADLHLHNLVTRWQLLDARVAQARSCWTEAGKKLGELRQQTTSCQIYRSIRAECSTCVFQLLCGEIRGSFERWAQGRMEVSRTLAWLMHGTAGECLGPGYLNVTGCAHSVYSLQGFNRVLIRVSSPKGFALVAWQLVMLSQRCSHAALLTRSGIIFR